MRVFSVPVSAPFLRTVITALIDGRLIDGYEARAHPDHLEQNPKRDRDRRAGEHRAPAKEWLPPIAWPVKSSWIS